MYYSLKYKTNYKLKWTNSTDNLITQPLPLPLPPPLLSKHISCCPFCRFLANHCKLYI